MSAKYIYSGECRIGKVGTLTNLVDNKGNRLRVGDVVKCDSIWIAPGKDIHEDIMYSIDLVVTSNEYRSIRNLGGGTDFIKTEDEIKFMVRGIANVDWLDVNASWRVYLKTKGSDVPVGSEMTSHKVNYKID